MNLTEGALIFLILLFSIALFFWWKISRINRTVQSNINEEANAQFRTWVDAQMLQMRTEIEKTTEQSFEAKFKVWISEKEIRKDAVSRSTSNLLGHIGEEFSPVFLPQSYGVSLNDFRHLGSPVDFIAFRGLSDDSEPEVIFIEIKTGKTKTVQGREKRVKPAIDANRVRYEVVNMNDLVGEAKEKIGAEIDSWITMDRQRMQSENLVYLLKPRRNS